jgi:radical SAM superfamily enzyme
VNTTTSLTLTEEGKMGANAEYSDVTRFDLEDAIKDMYRVVEDLNLAKDYEERQAAIKTHEMYCDYLCDTFETLVMQGKIL